MQEYVSDAIVLNAEPNGDLDVRFSLFTKQFGKLKAKAKSARKITSKLSPHLQAGNLVRVRIVEKNGLQVVDALKQSSIGISPPTLYFLDQIVAEGVPEPAVWQECLLGSFRWPEILRILGWDPEGASCGACGSANPDLFHVRTQEFFCAGCSLKIPQDEVIYIRERV